MQGSAAQSALHCIESPRRYSWEEGSGRPHSRAGPAPPQPRAAGGVCARSGSRVDVSPACGTGCDLKRAGRQAVGIVVSGTACSHYEVHMPCCRAVVMCLLATTSRELWVDSCPSHSMAQDVACRL